MNMSKCRLALALVVISVVLVGSVQGDRKALFKTISKEECKTIQVPVQVEETHVANELVDNISGKIIEYYNWFFKSKAAGGGESRTFGRIKRLQNAMLPIVFKLGILFAMIKIILFLSLKSVGIGLLILMINFAFIVSKVALFFKEYSSQKHGHGGWYGGGHGGGGGWPQKDVHLHVHPTTGYGKPAASYGGWNDRVGYKGSYISSGDQLIPYNGWAQQGLGTIQQEQPVEDLSIKKRSSAIEMPHNMAIGPPTIDPVQMAQIKTRKFT